MAIRGFLLLGCSAGALMLAAPAFAQVGDDLPRNRPSPSEQDSRAMSVSPTDIIVTAQKFSSRIQDTPLSIHAVEGKVLSAAGVNDIRSLTKIAPEIGLTTDNAYTKIAIRGVSSTAIGVPDDQAVTVNIDGQYISRPIALNSGFFDLERVEVLRGPQGTLYGRNASGGAINIVAAKPNPAKLGGYITGGYGNYDAARVEGAVNLPLNSDWAIRIAGLFSKHDGYIDNSATINGTFKEQHSQSENVKGIRGAIAGEIGNLNLYLAGEYTDLFQDIAGQYSQPTNAATPGLVQLPQPSPAYTNPLTYTIPANLQLPDGFDRGKYPTAGVGYLKNKTWAIRGRLDYNFDNGMTASYIGAYQNLDMSTFTFLASSRNPERPAAVCIAGANCYPLFTFPYPAFRSRSQSHEIRLAGDPASRLVWQIGGFRFHDRVPEATSGLFGNQIAGGSYLNYHYQPMTTSSWAAYGQATYWIVPEKFSLTAGLRYTRDEKVGQYSEYGSQIGQGPNPPGQNDVTRPNRRAPLFEAISTRLTWLARGEYRLTQDNMLYASVTKGYKGGGFDTVGVYQPEDITAYEFGSRNKFGPVTYNLTGFYYNYVNQQVNVIVSFDFGNQTLNVGQSRYWGVEQEFGVQLDRLTNFRATASYLDAKFTKFSGYPVPTLASPAAPLTPVTVDLAGNRPIQSPKWTITASFDKKLPTSIGDFNFSASMQFKSAYNLLVTNWKADEQPAYTQTDLSLDFVPAGIPKFSVGAYVRNLEGNRILSFASYASNIYNYLFGTPRTYGVRARLDF